MKKLLLIVFAALFFSSISRAQCFVTVTTFPSTCDTVCNGMILLQFGTPSYPVSVSLNGASPFSVSVGPLQYTGLCPGNYTWVAIDATGDTCTGTTSVVIVQLPPPVITIFPTNASCTGCSDGQIICQVSGGNAPYSFLWSTGTTTAYNFGLSPGVYCVTVTDASGCSVSSCDTVSDGYNGMFSLEGKIYFDMNSNGARDIGEVGLQNQSVSIVPNGAVALSNISGHYFGIVDSGTFDVSFNATPGWNLTSSPATYNLNVNSNVDSLDFGVYPDSTAGSAVISLTSFFPRCFQNVGYMMHVVNNGFTALNGTVVLTYDPALTYVNSIPVAVSHVGNVLSFDFTNLPPGSTGYFNLIFTEPAGGTSLSSTAVLDASDAFSNQINQSNTLSQMVSCSMDPNDKKVMPSGIGPLNYVAMNEWLTYQIRFQNTGTDTAFKVFVIDTIDPGLDINSLSIIGSSHSMTTSIHPSREVSFTFENILLPDSNVNEPASHGYILYRIKGIQSNPDPSTVENTAAIFFDLNSPVITNTTLTTFSDNFLGIVENNSNDVFDVFPNPMSHSATVRLRNNNHQEYTITVYDLAGRIVIASGKLENESYTLYKGDLNAGVYILEAKPMKNGPAERLRLIIID